MITTNVVFDHRGRAVKNKEGAVEIRVTVNRKSYYINSGVKVLREQFLAGVVVDRYDCLELNERVRAVAQRVLKEVTDCIDAGRSLDIAEVRRRVFCGVGEVKSNDFLTWVEDRIEMLNVGDGTRKHYKVLLHRLRDFGRMRDWRDVTVENIMQFDSWLHTLSKNASKAQMMMQEKPERLSDGCVYNYHKNLKRLLNLAVKADQIAQSPYVRLKGEFKRGDKQSIEYLTRDEMLRIENLELQRGGHLDTVRNLFVVQLYTGMSYADMQKFSISNYKNVDGKWIATDERVKTGVSFIGHLLPPVVAVLEQYNWQLPMMSNQKYNDGLRKIGKLAEIEVPLHSHLARHTFATFMLSNGVRVENLQRMMGHSDIKMTQRYAKTLAQSVHDEFEMIEKKLKEK